MEITSVRVHKVTPRENSRLRAYAEVTIDDAVAIHGIKVLEGDNGLYLGMPSDKTKHDIAHPISKEVRTMFEKEIFDKYEETEDAREEDEE